MGRKKNSSTDTSPAQPAGDGGAAAVAKLPGSKADLKTKAPEITHKNVNTVGHETVTGKPGDETKKNIKRKGGGGGAGRKPGRDALADFSDEPAELDANDPNFEEDGADDPAAADELAARLAAHRDPANDPAGFEVELVAPEPDEDAPPPAPDAPPPAPRFAQAGDYVTIHFVGRFVEGSKALFESTRANNRKPASFELGAHPSAVHVPGWERALLRVPLGRVARVRLPAALAFGASGRGRAGAPGFVPPNTDVEHELELLAINGEYAKPKIGSPRAVASEQAQRALDSFTLDEPSAPKKKPAGGKNAKKKASGKKKADRPAAAEEDAAPAATAAN